MQKKIIFIVLSLMACQYINAQFLMDMVDTSTTIGKGMLGIYKKFDGVRISGYMQPQWQITSTEGSKNYSGGDFAPHSNNRFMLRRGRIRFDYIHFPEAKGPSVQFVFQFDGTERGVFIRDFWGRIFENKYKLFAFTAGMFARPFSYELNLSSSDRESPERGRMSQILMKTERDMGVMVSFEPRAKEHPLQWLKLDAGIFNGQGLSSTADYDSHKDIISRLAVKPVSISKNLLFSGAVSYLNGGMLQNDKYVYHTTGKMVTVDSSVENEGKIAPRKYYGADAQLKIKTHAGFTELRAEMIAGIQTGTRINSETPPALQSGNDGHYIRHFNGAYFYLLHNIINAHHQLIIKYDWYDPNTAVQKNEITTASNFTSADIKFSTLGFGYCYYINPSTKLVLWYDRINNENTALSGFTKDVKDDVFTARLQFRF
ncbi:MAG: porin [Ferruginibacter sp.]